jgi:4-carboxymuconolactone decarboxylase
MPKNPDFGTFGRYQELLVEEMSPSQKRAYEYTMKEPGQVPGPYMKMFPCSTRTSGRDTMAN